MEDIKVFDPIVQVAIVGYWTCIMCLGIGYTYKLFLIKVK
jgi:hypothetical protein